MLVHIEYLDNTTIQWPECKNAVLIGDNVIEVVENDDVIHYVGLIGTRLVTLDKEVIEED